MLEIKNLGKKFGAKTVLEDINLCFEYGNIYGIVGENGAGKTTLFRCIAGLEPYSGKVDSPYECLQKHIGFLETNPLIMSHITGWEYLKLLCIAKEIQTENFEEQNIFGLPLDQYANTYSTGMKKKLALMGVLLRKNSILVLDEPFNGVDIQSNMMIVQIVKDLKKLNKIVIISSHILSTLIEICDEIILLSKGKTSNRVLKEQFPSLKSSMTKEIFDKNQKRIDLN